MNGLPKEINILGFTYKVIFDTGKEMDLKAGEAYGWSNIELQEIHIHEELAPDCMHEVFLHEVIEQIGEIGGLDLDHDKQLTPLSVGLNQVLLGRGMRFNGKKKRKDG